MPNTTFRIFARAPLLAAALFCGLSTLVSAAEESKTLYETQIIPVRRAGLAADVYTQLSDVEDEVNGFVTYDRRVEKLPEALMQAIAQELRGD